MRRNYTSGLGYIIAREEEHMSTPRRGALRLAVVATMAVAMLFAAAGADAQQAAAPRTLNMQASWPASSTFMENFTLFADRVNKATAGRLQVKTSAAGTIVPAF